MVEINELNQLFLQDFLFADDLFDEHMLEQVEHVWSELKVFNQTSVGRKRRRERATSWICIQMTLFVVHVTSRTGKRPHSLADEVIKVV